MILILQVLLPADAGRYFLTSFFFLFRYLPVMKEFSGTASVRLAELEDLFVDMKARVSTSSKHT